jgi:hypothetical protein
MTQMLASLKGVSVLMLLLTILGCSGIEVVKRQHRPGWHVDISGKQKSKAKDAQNEEAKLKPTEQNENATFSETESANCTIKEHSETKSLIGKKPSYEIETFPEMPALSQAKEAKQKILTDSEAKSDIPSNEKRNSLPLSGLLLLSPLLALKFPFKRVSKWGANNKFLAQTAIVGVSVVLGALAFYTGAFLKEELNEFASPINTIAISVALMGILIYPFGKASSKGYTYRKSLDAALMISGVFLFFSQGIIKGSTPFSSTITDPSPSSTSTWLVLAEIGLILLAIAVYLILLFIVLALACNLSCSGNILFANILAIGGFVILTTLLVFAIRGIHRSLKKKRERYKGDEEFEPAEK